MSKKLSGEKRKIQMQSKNKYPNIKKDIKPAIILYTEGEKTEPIYFDYLKKYCDDLIIHIYGCGYNTKSLVCKAKSEMKDHLTRKDKERIEEYFQEVTDHQNIHKKTGIIYQQVWCVFDADSFNESYQDAIILAKKNNFFSAISNQSFELWLYLHQAALSSRIYRKDFESKLTTYYGIKYDKSDNIIKQFFEEFFKYGENGYIDRVQKAIEHAFQMEKEESIRDGNISCNICHEKSSYNCYNCSPYTTVHYLVMVILYQLIGDKYKKIVDKHFKIPSRNRYKNTV